MSSLGVVSDGVVSSQADPLGQGSVLLGGLGQLLLHLEGLLGRHGGLLVRGQFFFTRFLSHRGGDCTGWSPSARTTRVATLIYVN